MNTKISNSLLTTLFDFHILIHSTEVIDTSILFWKERKKIIY